MSLLGAFAMTLLGCGAGTPEARDAGTDGAAADAAPSDASVLPDADTGAPAPLVWDGCSFVTEGEDDDGECATMSVPLDTARPDGAALAVFVKRLPATEPRRGAWILVDGGLVSSSVELEDSALGFFSVKAPDLDIVLFDHRGTGRSAPLGCPEQQAPDSLDGFSVAPEEARACHEALVETWGDDLASFSTTAAARDLAALVEHLRAEQDGVVFLYGISYGSLLVQRFLLLGLAHVDGVILDGTCPPGTCTMSSIDRDMDALAVRFFDECGADAFCSAHLGPDPVTTLEDLLADLDAGHCPEAIDLGFDAPAVRRVIADLLGYGAWVLRPAAAALVHRLVRCSPGDLDVLGHLAGVFLAPPTEPPLAARYASEPLGFQVAFAELWEHPAPSVATLEAFQSTARATAGAALRLARVREQWPLPAADGHEGQLPDTEVPMLVLHGTFDFISDAAAEAARDRYTASGQTYVAIPRAPHATIYAPTLSGRGCAGILMDQFLLDPSATIDTTCATEIAPIDFTSIGRYADPIFGTLDIWDGE